MKCYLTKQEFSPVVGVYWRCCCRTEAVARLHTPGSWTPGIKYVLALIYKNRQTTSRPTYLLKIR